MADADARARWGRVGDVFHQVLEAAPERRASVLEQACAGDSSLRREVESLLRSHAASDARLEHAPATAADLLSSDGADALVGRRIGPYEVQGIIGRGGMGVVYRAHDTRLGRDVALKALSSALAEDPIRRERLRREARAAAALNHAGIATVYALEEIDGQVYIASEPVPGHTLREELRAGPLPVDRAHQTLVEIARAMAAAHASGVVHRDLKPENIIRTTDDSIRVLDFGLAWTPRTSGQAKLTDDGAVLGTPAYMAPEQLRGHAVDARADVFAIGVLGYELLSGRSPFEGGSGTAVVARVLEGDPAPLAPPADADTHTKDAWLALTRVIDRCLRKAPDQRYASAGEVVAALERAGPEPTRPAPEPRPRDPRWWWRFHLSAAAAGHVLLVLPLWFAGQLAADYGLTAFLAGLAGGLGGSLLRLHLLFAQRSYPSEAAAQRSAARRWIGAADAVLVTACVAGGLLVLRADAGLSSLLIGGAVSAAVASLVVEPATTRAAFRAGQSPPVGAP